MLPHLLEVEKRIFESLADGGHTTKGSSLQLLALEQRLSILQKSNVVSSHGLYEVFCSGHLAQGDPEVVGIVKCVQEVLVEGMNVYKSWESVNDGRELLRKCLGCVFDFASVEGYNEAASA